MCFGAQLCEWGVSDLEGCYQQGRAPTLFHNPVSDSPSTPQSMGGSTPATLPVHVQKLKGDLSPKQNSVCTAACQGCWNMSHHGPHPNSADGRCLLEAQQAHTSPLIVGFNPNHLGGGNIQTHNFTPWHLLVLTMLHKYVITLKHRASLPNPQEPT